MTSRRAFMIATAAFALPFTLTACDQVATPFAPASDRPTFIFFYAPG
jgi:hypothetical protein